MALQEPGKGAPTTVVRPPPAGRRAKGRPFRLDAGRVALAALLLFAALALAFPSSAAEAAPEPAGAFGASSPGIEAPSLSLTLSGPVCWCPDPSNLIECIFTTIEYVLWGWCAQ